MKSALEFFSKKLVPAWDSFLWRVARLHESDPVPCNVTGRLVFFGCMLFVGLGLLLAKLYYEQVIRHTYWADRIAKHSDVTVRLPATRGEIRDRDGRVLAENRTSYTLEFYLPDILRNYRETVGKPPTVEYLATIRQMKKVLKEPDIVRVVNESVVPGLQQLGLAQDYNSVSLQRHFRTRREVPYAYREGLDSLAIAKYTQHGIAIPGVEIAPKPERRYPYGALAAHLLGYVGGVKDISAQPDFDDFNFYEPDPEGKSQVEHFYDKWLRGTAGARVLRRNQKGVIEGEIERVEPKAGTNVYLTIDLRIQYIVERALRDAGVGRGAAVVVNPGNGEILAMVSVPSYDPNTFIPAIAAKDWGVLTGDATDPLTNRAVQGYAPGSIYKPIIGLAGLRAGIPATRKFTCTGGVQYGDKYMKCWIAGRGAHGPLALPDALKHSCNAFFYQWGNAAGIEQIDAVGDALGLGERTRVPLSGESGGVLPGPDWLKRNRPGERWSDGHTANVSIGQGYVLASPLQMAMATATIANRGIAYEPRLVRRVLDREGHDVRDPDTGHLVVSGAPKVHADLHRAGITDEQIEAVRDGMRRVVAEGTGRRAQIKGETIAGKTGTAQFWRGDVQDNHAWFIAFAPYDAPRYALCVLVQGAKSGGSVSAPIAQRIMEQCLALERGVDPGFTALPPAPGSFVPVDLVDYSRVSSPVVVTTAPAAIPVGRPVPFDETFDPETLDGIEIPRAIPVAAPHPRLPEIVPAADARGRIRMRFNGAATPSPSRTNVFKPFFDSQ